MELGFAAALTRDPEKGKALSKRIAELRANPDQKHDDFLTRCRQKFGDRGWSCPGARS